MYCELYDKIGRRRFKGLQAPDYVEDNTGLVFMTLFGPPQAIRAVWAHLVRKRTKRSLVATNIQVSEGPNVFTVHTMPHLNRYHMTPVSIDGQQGICILRHDMNRLNAEYVVGGTEDEPSPWFEMALGQIPTLPYRKEWLPMLWQMGISEDLITEVDSNRCISALRFWKINTYDSTWRRMLSQRMSAT